MEFVEEYEDKIAKPNPIAPPFIIKVIQKAANKQKSSN